MFKLTRKFSNSLFANYFLISLLLSNIQSLIIIKSNVIFSTVENMILLLGIRSFVGFSPIITMLFKKWDLCFSIFLNIMGAVALILNYQLFGSIILAFSFSTANFIIRRKSLSTYSNTSFIRMAFHLGNILAGIFIIFFQKQFIFWLYYIAIILYAIFLSRPKTLEIPSTENVILLETNKFRIANIKNYLIWLFFGTALGMQTYSISIILPEHLSYNHGALPEWFGIIICSHSIFSIISLIPNKFLKTNLTNKGILIFLIFNSILISLIKLFNITDFHDCLMWVIVFSSTISIFSQIVDYSSAAASSLLIKDFSAGIGAGLTVLIMRSTHNSFINSLISIIFSFIAYFISHRYNKIKNV